MTPADLPNPATSAAIAWLVSTILGLILYIVRRDIMQTQKQLKKELADKAPKSDIARLERVVESLTTQMANTTDKLCDRIDALVLARK